MEHIHLLCGFLLLLLGFHCNLLCFFRNIRRVQLLENLSAAANHLIRQTCQTRHLHAIAVVCAATLNFPEENNILTLLLHGNAVILHAGKLALQLT